MQPLSASIEPEILTYEIEQPLRQQTVHTLILKSAVTDLLGRFGEAGLEVVMLRGQSLAATLYTPPGSRPQTDIDLLIREADETRCTALLEGMGYASLPNHARLFARGEVLLDVHVEPLGIERIASWARLTPLRAADFFDHGRSGWLLGEPAHLSEDAVVLPYLCFHAMKHSFERLLWLWDIALLANRIHASGDWHEVMPGIVRYRLQRPCFYALRYASRHLGAKVPSQVLEELRPSMDWRERSMYRRFMDHEQVPFLAERVFARMQPGVWNRLEFWRETIWPDVGVRRQVDADPAAKGGFLGKRLGQVGRAALMLLGECGALFRR